MLNVLNLLVECTCIVSLAFLIRIKYRKDLIREQLSCLAAGTGLCTSLPELDLQN